MITQVFWSPCLVIIGNEDPFSGTSESEAEEKDSVALLNEILGGMSVDEGDFSQEWMEVFGDTYDLTSAASGRTAESGQQKENGFFLPSQLLDQNLNNLQSSLSGEGILLLCVCICACVSQTSMNQKMVINKSSLVVKWIHFCIKMRPLGVFTIGWKSKTMQKYIGPWLVSLIRFCLFPAWRLLLTYYKAINQWKPAVRIHFLDKIKTLAFHGHQYDGS